MKQVDNSININENIKTLSDKSLLNQTVFLGRELRKNTILLLRHLREVEVRRLFVDLGYTSMHKYCIHELKFSEGEAQRRLTSARLLNELPEIEKQIETGSLNVTNLSKIQSFLRTEKAASCALDKKQKLELIQQMENKSTREVEKELVSRSHQPVLLAEKFQGAKTSLLLGDEFCKFEAHLSKEHQALLEDFRNLYAHELLENHDGAVLVFLLQKAIQYKRKKLGLIEKTSALDPKEVNSPDAAPLPSAPKARRSPYRKYISAHIKKQIWQRAQASCEYKDPRSHKRCASRLALELDHIQPLALGGGDEIQNLRLLCRTHNLRRAVKSFSVF